MSDGRPVLREVGGAVQVLLMVYDQRSQDWVPAERGVELPDGTALAIKGDRSFPRVDLEVLWGQNAQDTQDVVRSAERVVGRIVNRVGQRLLDQRITDPMMPALLECREGLQAFKANLRQWREKGLLD